MIIDKKLLNGTFNKNISSLSINIILNARHFQWLFKLFVK